MRPFAVTARFDVGLALVLPHKPRQGRSPGAGISINLLAGRKLRLAQRPGRDGVLGNLAARAARSSNNVWCLPTSWTVHATAQTGWHSRGA